MRLVCIIMIGSQSKKLESVIGFILAKGDAVRFDQYMQEHLYGEEGYFSKRAEIGSGDFGTESFRPAFAHLIFLNLQQQGLDGRDFLELGGGPGVFIRNYLAHSPETDYISADISKKFALMQAQTNGNAIASDAAALGLQSNSIEGCIFSNELIDNLPCRVFRITRNDDGVGINEEGYVGTDGAGLYFKFGVAERDEFLETYGEFLNQGIYPVADGDIISIAPKAVDVIKESLRVLKSGKIMFIDYGFGDALYCGRRSEELPYIVRRPNYDDSRDIAKILASPYDTDITYSVDFEFLRWVVGQIDPDAKVNYQHQVSLVEAFPQDQDPKLERKLHDHYDLTRFLVLSIDK